MKPIRTTGHNIRQLPQVAPQSFQVYTDEVKRQCLCKLCSEFIAKGERRLVIAYRPLRDLTPKKGGKVFVVKEFYHFACFERELGGGPSRTPWQYWTAQCSDCRFPITHRAHKVRTTKTNRWGHLCDACSREPRWRYCRYCYLYVAKYLASPILEESIPAGHFACDSCADEYHLHTIKNRKRLKNMSDEDREEWWAWHNVHAEVGFF